MKILVTGATGYIGGRLVPALVAAGHDVRAMARNPRKLDRRRWESVEVVPGDMFEPDSLRAALRGVDVAYYLIHSMTNSAREFAELDVQAARNFAAAAAQEGVHRIIYLGGLGDDLSNLSNHLRSRHETGEALRSASVPVTELRAAIIVGSGSASFEIIRDLVSRLPFMVCPKWVRSRCEPIGIRQVLTYLIGVLDEPRSVGEVLEIGDGEVLTYADLMRQCGEVMGRRIRILTVPVLTPRLSSYWLNLVTSVPMSVARPLVEGMRSDVVCTDHRIKEWIPTPRVSYRESVQKALARERTGERETRWTDASAFRSSHVIHTGAVPLEDLRSLPVNAPADRVFALVQSLGGDTGWYFGNWAWRLRGMADWLLGGVGMRRGRRHPSDLAVGDPVDFWRVEEFIPDRLLVLKAEMKVPGVARLRFEVEPEAEGHCRLVQQARFWPSGFAGRLYWYALLPVHLLIFSGMARKIARLAERGETTQLDSSEGAPRHE